MFDDDQIDTRMGYTARWYSDLAMFQRSLSVAYDDHSESAKKQAGVGAVRANRLQFGFRLLIGEEHPAYV